MNHQILVDLEDYNSNNISYLCRGKERRFSVDIKRSPSVPPRHIMIAGPAFFDTVPLHHNNIVQKSSGLICSCGA